MSAATKHTPTPWRVADNGYAITESNEDPQIIAQCDGQDVMFVADTDECEANAAIIVRAVNCYVEAMKLKDEQDTGDPLLVRFTIQYQDLEAVNKALVSALEAVMGRYESAMYALKQDREGFEASPEVVAARAALALARGES